MDVYCLPLAKGYLLWSALGIELTEVYIIYFAIKSNTHTAKQIVMVDFSQ